MTEIQNLGKLVQRVYDGKTWHGPSLKEVLKDIDDRNYKIKFGDSHSIIQLVQHMVPGARLLPSDWPLLPKVFQMRWFQPKILFFHTPAWNYPSRYVPHWADTID